MITATTKSSLHVVDAGVEGVDTRPERVREAVVGSLGLGADRIDLLYQAGVPLSAEEMAALDAALGPEKVSGPRDRAAQMAEVDR